MRLHCAGGQSPLSGVWFVVCPCVGGCRLLSVLLFGMAVGRRHVVGHFILSEEMTESRLACGRQSNGKNVAAIARGATDVFVVVL